MNSIAVFCGSNKGFRQEYEQAARILARALVERQIRLVYGGGKVGLMGIIADEAMRAGGTVIGVIPCSLDRREVGHHGITELKIVGSMHERKAMMAELADGFIAMPGGIGTFEEFFEILTWAQLGIHEKPCGLLNVSGYYDGLLALCDNAVREEFLMPAHRRLILSETEVTVLLDEMANYQSEITEKWLDRGDS